MRRNVKQPSRSKGPFECDLTKGKGYNKVVDLLFIQVSLENLFILIANNVRRRVGAEEPGPQKLL